MNHALVLVVCTFHAAPPFVVRRIIPLSPPMVPVEESENETALRCVTVPLD
jgi:hypothetical protein